MEETNVARDKREAVLKDLKAKMDRLSDNKLRFLFEAAEHMQSMTDEDAVEWAHSTARRIRKL